MTHIHGWTENPAMTLGIRLDGRTALITGGGSGLGFAVAKALNEQGAAVAILGRTKAKLEAAAEELAEAGGAPVLAVVADVTEDGSVQDAVRQIHAWQGRLDIVVNSAAPLLAVSPLAEAEEATVSDALDAKAVGYLRVARAALPFIEKGGTGRIINIAGMAAHVQVPNIGVAAAVNAAVVALTSYLAAELAPQGVLVNGISPGMTLTQVWKDRHAVAAEAKNLTPEQVRDGMVDNLGIRLGRWARPEEIAASALYLASDLATYVTGQTLQVDGGLGKSVI
ncbi:SDR family NAD(P)-dependent oxidoreductase [Streptomyces sp. NPDC127036]|uniref:SDR family NAD(P)-dependent oxidoreductase n=1 Tax=Streptomyces sp. NPDC127036 TaxID=3347112 RepID=UPI00364D2096